MSQSRYESELANWIQNEKSAHKLVSLIGTLSFEKSIEIVLYRRRIIGVDPKYIVKTHKEVSHALGHELSVATSLKFTELISEMDLPPSKIDLVRLLNEWNNSKDKYNSEKEFIEAILQDVKNADAPSEPKNVVLFGFGRIGRLAAREIIKQFGTGAQLRLRAIVTRSNTDKDIIKRASLLRNDSVHGPLLGTVDEDLENKCLVINGNMVHMIASNDPSTIDYEAYGIKDALLIDNSGVYRDEEGLSQHLKSKGISQVLLTAPGKGDLPNIVYGINHAQFDIEKQKIFTAASCTTNAIAPVLSVIEKEIGILHGHIETVHSYTNDQNLLDNYHKKDRRGRAAPINMVITETGAASAVSKVLPNLMGKLTGNAVRVPTPDVSLAILNLDLKESVSKESINNLLREAALDSKLVSQIQYSNSTEAVSSDYIGNSHSSIVDGPATIISPDGKSAVLYVWYDNEYGYTKQVFRLAKYISKVRRPRYY